MPRRDGKTRLHAKFGAWWEPSHRENDGAQGRRCTQRCFEALRARAVPGIVHACIPPGASGALLHFGAVGRPPDPRLRTRDPGRFEHQRENAGVSTHVWVMLDVLSEFGCLSLRFGFHCLVSDPDVPHRVVRVPHFGPGSGRRTCADPRAGLGDRPRGRGASARGLEAEGCRLAAKGAAAVRSFLQGASGTSARPPQRCLGPTSVVSGGRLQIRCPWPARLAITSQWETLHLDNCEIASANTKTPQANPNNYSYARITGDPLLMDYPVFEQGERSGTE